MSTGVRTVQFETLCRQLGKRGLPRKLELQITSYTESGQPADFSTQGRNIARMPLHGLRMLWLARLRCISLQQLQLLKLLIQFLFKNLPTLQLCRRTSLRA